MTYRFSQMTSTNRPDQTTGIGDGQRVPNETKPMTRTAIQSKVPEPMNKLRRGSIEKDPTRRMSTKRNANAKRLPEAALPRGQGDVINPKNLLYHQKKLLHRTKAHGTRIDHNRVIGNDHAVAIITRENMKIESKFRRIIVKKKYIAIGKIFF